MMAKKMKKIFQFNKIYEREGKRERERIKMARHSMKENDALAYEMMNKRIKEKILMICNFF